MKKLIFLLPIICGFVGNGAFGGDCKPTACVLPNLDQKDTILGQACLYVHSLETPESGNMLANSYVCAPNEVESRNDRNFCGGGAVVLSHDLTKAKSCHMPYTKFSKRSNYIDALNGHTEYGWSNYDDYTVCTDRHIRELNNTDLRGRVLDVVDGTNIANAERVVFNTNKLEFYKRNDTGKRVVLSSDPLCYAFICSDTYKTSSDKKSCVKGSGGGNGGGGATDPCKKYKTTNEPRYDCCLKEKAGVAKWENDKCNCTAEGTKWNYDATKPQGQRGQCVGKSNEETQQCTYILKGVATCPNGTVLKIGEAIELNVPKSKGTCAEFNRLTNENEYNFKLLIRQWCNANVGSAPVQTTPTTPAGPTEPEIEAAKASLNAFFQTAESDASVWKDADGNFNTARLASDLTAGVVLGTVGGVVSGVVIKKKQVEKGFDALNCSVGGQKIADWGDTFEVGLRR